MKLKDFINKFEIQLLLINWGICLTISLIITFVKPELVISYVLGSLTSYIVLLLYIKNQRDYGDPKANKVMKLFTNIIVRIVFSILMILLIFVFNKYDIVSLFTSIISYTLMYIVISVYYLIYSIKIKKTKMEE